MTEGTAEGKPKDRTMTPKPPRPSITDAKLELPAGADRPFDAPGLAKTLLRTARSAALATNDPESGHPLATLVTVATDLDGAPLLFLSGLSLHTRNLKRDGRGSLLFAVAGKGDPLAHPRLTLVGQFAPNDAPELKRRFLAKHPKAQLYAELPDFAIWRLSVTGVHLNGGFARAAALAPADILLDLTGADALIAAEAEAVAHMNEDHADAVSLYATRLAGEAPGAWVVTGIDPEGLDLAAGDRTARVPFPRWVMAPGVLAKSLKEMAAEARGEPPG